MSDAIQRFLVSAILLVLPTAIAPGAKMTLLNSAFGTMIFGFAVFLWFFLQLRWRMLQAAEADAGQH